MRNLAGVFVSSLLSLQFSLPQNLHECGRVTLPSNVFKLLDAVPVITVQGVRAGRDKLFQYAFTFLSS